MPLTPEANGAGNSVNWHAAGVRLVSESNLELRPNSIDSDAFEIVRKIVLDWIGRRSGRPLPESAYKGESFDLEDVGSQRTGAISIDEPRFWVARLDDSDKKVPQRIWTTEIGIAQKDASDPTIVFGSRLQCVTRGPNAPFLPSIQAFVRRIVDSVKDVRVEGRRVRPSVWVVDSEEEVEALVRLMSLPTRRLGVLVCALPESSEDPTSCLLDSAALHLRTLGSAHVAILTSSASYHLTEKVGREFSVFRSACRLYRPGFSTRHDEPYRHPLFLPQRIVEWAPNGAPSFLDYVVSNLLQLAAMAGDSQSRIPSFTTVRQIAAEQRMIIARKSGSSDADLLSLALQEISELKDNHRRDKETYEGLVKQYEDERDKAMEEAVQAQTKLRFYLDRIQSLERRQSSGESENSTPIPTTLDDLESWAGIHLLGSVEVHNRAFQGAKKSQYHDPSLIYRSLLLLRDHYVPMRRIGGLEIKRRFDEGCATLGLVEAPSLAPERYGEQGSEYMIRFAGRNEMLDRHLKKGNSKDSKFCFRLYFFWHDESQQVVVGWLPSHLDTRLT